MVRAPVNCDRRGPNSHVHHAPSKGTSAAVATDITFVRSPSSRRNAATEHIMSVVAIPNRAGRRDCAGNWMFYPEASRLARVGGVVLIDQICRFVWGCVREKAAGTLYVERRKL